MDPCPWVEVSLDNLLHNLEQIKGAVPASTGIIAVVKDAAYGCGAIPVSKALEQAGVAMLAVARADEARGLRGAGVRSPILVLGPVNADDVRWAATADVHLTLNDLHELEAWASAAAPVSFHAAVDTGMGRMGISVNEIGLLARALTAHANLRLAGVSTHFACADDPSSESIALQSRRFADALAALDQAGLTPACIHIANSAAILNAPRMARATHVRPGIMLYGCRPDPARPVTLALRPVAGLKGRVLTLRKTPADTPLSYGWRFTTPRETTIATIGIGYAHGLPRLLTNRGDVLIRGGRYRIAGTVTMDYCLVDAGPEPPIRVGDEVTAIGCQGDDCITPDEVAMIGGTIGYEVLCNLSAAIPRVYIRNGTVALRREAQLS
jgi:alanine racemase